MTTAFNEPKYKIDAPDFRCQACGKEVPCESFYWSAVLFQAEAFQRQNYCADCWRARFPALAGPTRPSAQAQAAPDGGVFACWRTRRPPLPADTPRKMRFDAEFVLEFFRRLGDAEPTEGATVSSSAEPSRSEKEELRFVLALLLVRKKALNFLSSQDREGAEHLKMCEKREPGRVYWVRNPNLSDAKLEKVRDRIGELLQMQV